eukprot:s768_g28.t1
MAFFKDGFQKLVGAVKGHDSASSGYRGQLSTTTLRVSGEGALLGPGGVEPQTLTSWNSLIAFSTTAGHLRLLSQEMDCSLKNPAAPVAPAFLLFCRSGLLLSIGLADVASPMAAGKATWVAQWWELKTATSSIQAAHQALVLRFGVSCVAVAEEASLVFLGTDEGDVRAFDAGENPHMASYCIPCTTLYGRKDRPCPVAALGVSPSSCEVVIANGEGGLLLWSFEKHRAVRSFDSMSGVTSILWCRSGSHFLAASRSDISLFSRSSSSALARMTLPGGSAQGVSLLHWDAQMTSESTVLCGDLWLRRGAPNPSLQRLSGENWSRADTVMEDVMGATAFRPSALQTRPCGCPAMPSTTLFSENHDLTMMEVAMVAVTSSGSFMVAGASKTYPLTWGSLPLANFSCMELLPSSALQAPVDRGVPVDVDAPLSRQWAVRNGELKDAIAMPPTEFTDTDDGWFVCSGPENSDEPEAVQWQLPTEPARLLIQGEISLGLDAKVQISFGSLQLHLDVSSQQLRWPGGEAEEMDLAPGSSHFLKLQLAPEDGGCRIEIQLDDVSWAKDAPIEWPPVMEWRSSEGELRLRDVFLEGVSDDSEVQQDAVSPGNPMRWVEEMFAHHLAHFQSFFEGRPLDPSPQEFAASWTILSGGPQGLLLTGHLDGTVRLWLRSASNLLLLQVLSLQPCSAMPWRLRLEEAEEPNYRTFDGIDACPAFSTGESSPNEQSISQVAMDIAAGAVVAGCISGEVVLFLWRSSSSAFSASEAAEWRVQLLLSEAQDSAELPQVPSGFVCAMRLRQHQVQISLLKLVHFAPTEPSAAKLLLFSCDSSSHLCITDGFTGEMLSSLSMASESVSPGPGGPGGPGPPPETLEAVEFSPCVLQVAPADGKVPAMAAVPGLSAPIIRNGAFAVAMSSGELRQLAGPGFQLLDARIRETRLPRLSGGKVLMLHLCDTFLVAVQATSCSLFLRHEDRLQPSARTVKFSKRVLAANICEVAGELCLYLLTSGPALDFWALPSLHQVASLPVSQMVADAADSAVIASDGSLVIRSKSGGLWFNRASDTSESVALESSVRAATLAQIIQGLQKSDEMDTKTPTQSSSTGMFGSLFTREVKTLRSCVSSCPSDLDGDRLDRSRGLTAAAAKLQPRPPPPAGSSGTSAAASSSRRPTAAGVMDQLAETTNRALERGEKISSLANRSQRMAEDADEFLGLAKQLNARQNRRATLDWCLLHRFLVPLAQLGRQLLRDGLAAPAEDEILEESYILPVLPEAAIRSLRQDMCRWMLKFRFSAMTQGHQVVAKYGLLALAEWDRIQRAHQELLEVMAFHTNAKRPATGNVWERLRERGAQSARGPRPSPTGDQMLSRSLPVAAARQVQWE